VIRFGLRNPRKKERKKVYYILEKIPGQLEASFLIFLTLGSIKQSNTNKDIGFISLPTQEAEYSFPGFIQTIKQTNKQYCNIYVYTNKCTDLYTSM